MTEVTQDSNHPETIPYSRFQEVIQEKNELKTRLDEAVNKLTSSEKERDEFKANYEKSQKDTQRTLVATKYSLPPELAARLQGETEEELIKDAELLSKLISNKNPGLPDVPRGSETQVPKSLEESVTQIFKEKFNPQK